MTTYTCRSCYEKLNDGICSDPNGEADPPTLLHALSPQNLLLATDSSALHIFDLRSDSTIGGSRAQQTHRPHYDFVSSLTPLAPSDASTSGYSRQWFSTGGSTTAVTDIRKGVIFESGDFEEELLSSTVIGGKDGTRIIAGGERGVARIWEDGVQGAINGKEKKLPVEKGESLDVMCLVPRWVAEEDMVAVGLGDGTVTFARTDKRPGVAGRIKHDELEGVVALGFDSDGRFITGGGNTVKVWEKHIESSLDDETDPDDDEKESNEVTSDLNRRFEQNGHDTSEDGSSEDEKPKRKKRKRNKGKGKNNNSHVMAFTGMD
ncbi:MAG: hypothetical protein LQ338_003809 [Usnochroma carphineum]|nr:MAG: hypothetical protein LQ338_003809 [Usnochroma carphineum]